MRHTEDNHIVQEHERVYEIISKYYNDEWSECEPYETMAVNVPAGTKMWVSKYICQLWCNGLNRLRRDEIERMIDSQK